VCLGWEGGASYSDAKVANRNGTDFGWEMGSRGSFATPAGFPRHDCSPYSHVHVRRESLGFFLVRGPFPVAPRQSLRLLNDSQKKFPRCTPAHHREDAAEDEQQAHLEVPVVALQRAALRTVRTVSVNELHTRGFFQKRVTKRLMQDEKHDSPQSEDAQRCKICESQR
jgi:hypothetical protein